MPNSSTMEILWRLGHNTSLKGLCCSSLLLAFTMLQQKSVFFWHEEVGVMTVNLAARIRLLTRFQTTVTFYTTALEPLDYCPVWSFKWNTTCYNIARNYKHKKGSNWKTWAYFLCSTETAHAVGSCFFSNYFLQDAQMCNLIWLLHSRPDLGSLKIKISLYQYLYPLKILPMLLHNLSRAVTAGIHVICRRHVQDVSSDQDPL